MATVNQYMTHALNFLKLESVYGQTEEVRMANTVNEIISNYYRWHWNETDCTNVSLTTPTQDYTINAVDQNTVLAIASAYLTDASSTYPDMLVGGDKTLSVTSVTGRPMAVQMLSPTKVRVWPAPDATYTLHWRKNKRATVFTTNTETWDVPAAFDSIAKAGMIWQLLAYADDVRAETWQNTFYQWLANQKEVERRTMGRKR